MCSGAARGATLARTDTTKPLRHPAHSDGQRGRRPKEARFDQGRQHARAVEEEERDLREDPDDRDGLRLGWGQNCADISAVADLQASKLCEPLEADESRVEVPRTREAHHHSHWYRFRLRIRVCGEGVKGHEAQKLLEVGKDVLAHGLEELQPGATRLQEETEALIFIGYRALRGAALNVGGHFPKEA